MTESIVLRTEQDGVEFFTVAFNGESGMSQSGLAKLCGVRHSSIQNLLDNLADGQASKWLKACLGKSLYLADEFTKNGGQAKIITAEVCAAIIEHYAFTGKEKAQFTLRKFHSMSINTWIQSINQWRPRPVIKLPEELLVDQAIALLEARKEILALQAQAEEQKLINRQQESINTKTQTNHNLLEIKVNDHDNQIIGIEAEVGRYGAGTGSHYTILAWATILGIKDLSLPQASKLGKKASKLCRQLKVLTGRTRDVRFGIIKTYPEFVLEQVDFKAAA